MAKRPRPRRACSLDSRVRRILQSDAGLVPGSSAVDVAQTLRSRHPEFQRYKLELFASVVRGALSSLPPSGDAGSDSTSHPSARRRRSHEDTTSSSTTTTHSQGRL